MSSPLNILCVSTYFKGAEFIEACSEAGNNVYLLTYKKLENEAWPWDVLTDTMYLDTWNDEHVIKGLAYILRNTPIHRVVALDDFDVERAAYIREFFRMPGMGLTTARYFRDKLAMRAKAADHDIPVPSFTTLFNDGEINAYTNHNEAPWLIKPRAEASATGIKKLHNEGELWNLIEELGDERINYLIEKFEPGDVFHVDSLTWKGEVIFTSIGKYLDTPFEVAHGGGIFRSCLLDESSGDFDPITQLNEKVIQSFGLQVGASHTEFIKSKESGKFYFLETSSRVGGANLSDLVEIATGINLWKEWARMEDAQLKNKDYQLPTVTRSSAGIIVSLSRYEHPSYDEFQHPEIVWRMQKDWHIGMIAKTDSWDATTSILDELADKIAKEYHASLPPPETLRD